jgi:hypothetical protein
METAIAASLEPERYSTSNSSWSEGAWDFFEAGLQNLPCFLGIPIARAMVANST